VDTSRDALDAFVALFPVLGEGRLLRASEVAEILGVARRRVYALHDSGDLRAVRIGRSLRFSPVDVASLLLRGTLDDGSGWS
jgi:excisionase family DNA binding protein